MVTMQWHWYSVIKFQKKKQDIFSCVRNIIEIYPYDTECIVNRKKKGIKCIDLISYYYWCNVRKLYQLFKIKILVVWNFIGMFIVMIQVWTRVRCGIISKSHFKTMRLEWFFINISNDTYVICGQKLIACE